MEEARLAQQEEACHYTLYPPHGSDLPVELAELTALVTSLTQGYIWHRDACSLHIEAGHFEGKTRVGDCVDDEWYIVWLLREVTRQRQRWVASIYDSDGQFLLIEAAEVLPKWVSPSNAENRVLITNGRLHLVPLEYTSPLPPKMQEGDEETEEDGYIAPEEALRLVLDPSIDTLAPAAVEQAVWSRIAPLPSSTHAHRTIAYLPSEIATALRAQPQLVAAAVRTFYERDPIQLKACRAMSRFPPTSSARTLIRMTRPLYAQLVAQRFYAPKPFEKAKWFEGIEAGTDEYRRRDVGMKLSCGFEMLYQETIASLRTVSLPTKTTEPAYLRFRARLTELGYFRNEVKGSKLYKELEADARRRWEALPPKPAFASEVEAAISSAPPVSSEVEGEDQEDDESWLDLDPEALEEMLRAKGEREEEEEEKAAQAEADKLDGFAAKLGRFVEGEGSMDGALFDDEVSDDDGEDSSDEEMAPTAEERQAKLDKLVPALPTDEWGQKEAPPEPTPSIPPGKPEDRLEGLQDEKHDGVSSDEDDEFDEDEDEDLPAVGGEDVDMSSEMDDFLRFTREALGISEEQYDQILSSRAQRGAFVPKPAKKRTTDLPDVPPAMRQTPEQLHKSAQAARNPNLDSFDALMAAMDAQLTNSSPIPKATPSAPPPAPEKEEEREEVAMDEDAEMDAELHDLLERDDDANEPADYTLIKNFLESYKSQAGAAGPVSTLAGRLGAELPGSRGAS